MIPTHYLQYLIPRQFYTLAKIAACHREHKKWYLLYEILWKITHGEKNLLNISSHPLIAQLLLLEKAVRRDAHKMKAFVRFRQYQADNHSYYIAWHQPDHYILRSVAPFFQRRFSTMDWAIITPDETAVWHGNELQFLPGIENFAHRSEDLCEDLWRTYYRAIFNPARIKLKAMKKEMPVRYWKNLPETPIIQEILQEAPARVTAMLKHTEGFSQTARDYFPETLDYENLKKAAGACQACPLYRQGKQTVFGRGHQTANIMIVAEQPGKQEDAAGLPLIGPTGQFLQNLLLQLKVNPEEVYYTNAVKHFKHTIVENKILYQNPTIKEIQACKPWLEAEIESVKPKVILCLGLVAAKSLISGGFHLKAQRGKIHYYKKIPVIATYHPAAILRNYHPENEQQMTEWFKHDIEKAFYMLNENI
jgi:probable DNA metabolism protein